ncbi:MAG: M14 family metallopeptidase [Salinibacter sp.]
MARRVFTALLLSLLVGTVAQAQPVDLSPERFSFDPNLTYSDQVPTPEEALGYEIGTQFTLHADAVDYLRSVAEASDRVKIGTYGETYEGRALIYLVFTSPQNQGRLDELKRNSRRLSNPPALSTQERSRLLGTQPVTVSFSYNIHGNEPASTEAALRVAYRLAAAQDSTTRRILENAVFVMYPVVNPDGRDRYVYWARSMQQHQVATNPNDIVHDEPWPQGRTNHYWFDLNRDWVWNVHPETEGLTGVYQEFMPQVHTDYHEQGYNDHYFTMPGTTPRNPLLPDRYVAWADTFGRANIRAFNQNQVAYFTKEAFDFFYPSYGSSYPSVMGGIGMLTEQAGIGAGRAVENEDGYTLTLRQRVFDHYTTSFATLRAAVRNRRALLEYDLQAHSQETNTVETAAYVFPDDEGEGYLYDVIDILRHHGITVERATEPLRLEGALSYRSGERADRRVEEGAYVVPADQPRHLFVNTLLRRQISFQDSVMYDMSTWSAPLAYNLTAYSVRQEVQGETVPIDEVPTPPSGVVNPNARYAFVVEWEQRHAPEALSRLWKQGYRVRAAAKPFTIEGRSFGAGSLIVLLGRNPEKTTAAADMRAVAKAAGVKIVGVNTGRTSEGPDLGSENNAPVKQPTVGLLVDQPFSTYTSGQLWYLFDRETELPITRVRASNLKQSATSESRYARYGKARLQDFDVLVLPGGGRLGTVFDSTQVEALRDWVQGGGTLVGTEESARFLTEQASGLTSVEAVRDTAGTRIGPYTAYAARSDSAGLGNIPGAALDGVVDTTHPLAFGVGERVYSLKYGTAALEPSADLQTAAHYAEDADDLLVSGYASQQNLKQLAGASFAGTVEMGEGRVVFLVDNTQYRMFWRGPSRMMQNAVMLVPGLVD